MKKVRERPATGAANMTKPGADLIAWYLNPDRLPVDGRWSRKHAYMQNRLCQLYAAPVIGAVTCQDITASHTQKVVNAAPTAGEGGRAVAVTFHLLPTPHRLSSRTTSPSRWSARSPYRTVSSPGPHRASTVRSIRLASQSPPPRRRPPTV
jgi:hypothetical protein